MRLMIFDTLEIFGKYFSKHVLVFELGRETVFSKISRI